MASLLGCSMTTTQTGTGGDPVAQESSNASAEALENYVEAERKTMPEVLAANPGVYSDATIEAAPPSTVIYTYTYVNQIDPVATAANFDAAIPEFQSALDAGVFPVMAQMGVTGTLYTTFIYYNADGSLIWENTFASQ
jgi:hypothetical protein